MVVIELSAGLAVLAALCSALQALSVEYGLTNGDVASDRSAPLAAAVLSIVVSVAVFWALFVARDGTIAGLSPVEALPFVVAGLGNPAAFRLLYFRSIDRIGARISAAVVSANPAIATVLAIPLFGESVTLLTGLGLGCIVVGAVVLQLTDPSAADSTDILETELSRVDPGDLAFPVTAMVLLGVSFVLVDLGLQGYDDPLLGAALGQTSALVGFVALFGASDRMRHRVVVRDPVAVGAFVLAGLFVAGNWLAWFSALQLGTVVTVVPLANTYPLFVVAITYLLVRQVPKSPRVLAGIVAIVAGATLMQVA